jgi:ribosomal-protein-alanine N-acetyltransferase
MIVRAATVDDLDAIAAVEATSFDAPWTREIFAQELERALARVVVTELDAVVGFACTWHVVDEAHLLRVAVLPAARGRGIGTALLARVFADARAGGCVQVDLEVARSNVAALALYRRAGFVEVGVRPGYYQHPKDDAVLLRAALVPPG